MRIQSLLFENRLCNQKIASEPNLILVHPQTIGFTRFIRLIEKRQHPAWVYLMDSSFFCVRSYNLLPNAAEPCTLCLSKNTDPAQQNNCKPFPVDDNEAFDFIRMLSTFSDQGKVNFLVQNQKQYDLARIHFGSKPEIRVIGLWLDELDSIISQRQAPTQNVTKKQYDVVFHGAPISAKGAHWALELATQCPSLGFYFPFSFTSLKLGSDITVPANCTFEESTWETGLCEVVANSKITLVPSLWSAPIEGALIKSLIAGRVVAIVENPSSFSSELPPDIVLTLPRNTAHAATILSSAISNHWQPNPENLDKWIKNLISDNRHLLEKLDGLSR